jgi:hypothetical protein
MGENQWQRPFEMENRRCSMIVTTKHHHLVHCTPALYTGGSGVIAQSWGELSWNRFFCFSSIPPCNCWIVAQSRPQPLFPHPFQHVVKESSYHPILNCLWYRQCDYTEHTLTFPAAQQLSCELYHTWIWHLPELKTVSFPSHPSYLVLSAYIPWHIIEPLL